MQLWTKWHAMTVIPVFVAGIAFAILLGYLLRNKSEKIRLIPVQIIAVTLIVIEIVKQTYSIIEGYDLYHIPLHFCSLFLFLIPLAAFYNGKHKRGVRMYTMACCTALFMFMVFWPTIIYSAGAIQEFTTDVFSFHTVFFHLLVCIAYFLMISLKLYQPSTKRDMKAIFFSYTGYAVLAAVLAQVLKTNYAGYYRGNADLAELIRVTFVNAMGWFGQLLYVIGVYIASIGFVYGCYWLFRLGVCLYYKIKDKVLKKDKKVDIQKFIKEEFSQDAEVVKKIDTTNNEVYIIKKQGSEYIFKTYHCKTWPENGKLLFVNELLEREKIPYPKVEKYTRENSVFENGFVIEERMEGVAALENNFDKKFGTSAYKKLAKFIKKVHKISFDNFGYLNNGKPDYETFSSYMKDTLLENLGVLTEHKTLTLENVNETVERICQKIDKLDLKPVLTHGDLSMRNVIYNDGKLVLIDWDDAMSLPWQADVARMTFDMKFEHDELYDTFRKAFLKEYLQSDNFEEYDKFEKLYHIFVACDWLVFSVKRNQVDTIHQKMIDYLNQLVGELTQK